MLNKKLEDSDIFIQFISRSVEWNPLYLVINLSISIVSNLLYKLHC